MVKIVAVVLFVLLSVIPVLAQEDYPKVQTSFGYANLGFVDFGIRTLDSRRPLQPAVIPDLPMKPALI